MSQENRGSDVPAKELDVNADADFKELSLGKRSVSRAVVTLGSVTGSFSSSRYHCVTVSTP